MNKTKIEYLDYTWNPIAMHCDPVSSGCTNCWHRRMANRLANNPTIGEWEREAYAGGPPVLIGSRLKDPFKVKKPSMIGTQFMGDLFHEKITNAQLGDVFQTISHGLPRHIFMILTKRPERMADYLSNYWIRHPNFWIGVSVEDQKTADERIPILLQIPAAMRFVSVEPMLDYINIEPYLNRIAPHNHDFNSCPDGCPDQPFVQWVICGKENGPGARPCKQEWINSLYDQCKNANIPFFDKSPNFLARKFPEVNK